MEERNTDKRAMIDLSDEELFVAWRDGDAAALDTLVSRIRVPLFRTIIRYVGDKFLAEDIFQETMERIIRHSGRYDPSRPFRGWAWRIAVNRSLDYLRKRGREISDEFMDARPSDWTDPETHAARRETAGMLGKAIEALPEEQREVFMMREEAGMSFAEIASATGAPLGTVLSRMHYALSKLRENMGVKP